MAIEVLIGVIMLGLVLVVSYMALERISTERCRQDMIGNFQELGITLNQVLTSGTGREKTVRFEIPGCFDPSRSKIYIDDSKTGAGCIPACKRELPACSILIHQGFDRSENTTDENIARKTQAYCLDTFISAGEVEKCGTSNSFFPYGRDTQPLLRSVNSFTVKKTDGGICINDNRVA